MYLMQFAELCVRDCRALIVSNSSLFVDAIRRLLEEEGIEVVAQVATLDEARLMLNGQKIDAIVVSHENSQQDAEIVSHLMDSDQKRHIVFLAMSGNEMVVYHRERIANVTPSDLVEAICVTKTG